MEQLDYPIFVFHELALRLSELDRGIGRYLSHSLGEQDCVLVTYGGSIKIYLSFLERQYADPGLISKEEIRQLAAGFMPS